MKNIKILIILLIAIFLVPLKTEAIEYKTMPRQYNYQIRTYLKNESFFWDEFTEAGAYVKYLKPEDNSTGPIVAYCIEYDIPYLPGPGGTESQYNYVKVDDLINKEYGVGIQYIVQKGFKGTTGYYPTTDEERNKTILNKTTNAPIKGAKWYVNYWATQTAIWWFMDEVTNTNIIGKDFKNKAKGSNPTEFQKIVYDLVTGAVDTYKKDSVKVLTLKADSNKLKLEGDYYVSDLLTVTNTELVGKYTVSITSGTNFEIVNKNNEPQTSFSQGFKIRIPASKVTQSEKVSIKVTATIKTSVGHQYSNGVDQPVSIFEDGRIPIYGTKTLVVDYQLPSRDLSVAKIDSVTKELVTGATLLLKDSDGHIVKTITITNQRIVVEDLPYGTYTLEEETAPQGYIKSNEVKTITINENSADPILVDFNNKPNYTIKVVKLDASSKKPLAGATLELRDKDGNLVQTITTTDTYVLIENLDVGVYTLKEIKAPEGYALAELEEKFEIKANGEMQTINFLNSKIIVPATASSVDYLIASLILAGFGVMFIIYSKKEKSF